LYANCLLFTVNQRNPIPDCFLLIRNKDVQPMCTSKTRTPRNTLNVIPITLVHRTCLNQKETEGFMLKVLHFKSNWRITEAGCV